MTDPSKISIEVYAQTDVGMVRAGNEDNFLVLNLSTGQSWTASDAPNGMLFDDEQGDKGSLFAVSDGVGGGVAGAAASRMVVETIRDRMLQFQTDPAYRERPFQERLRLAVEEANQLIYGENISESNLGWGRGATFTAMSTQGNQVYLAQVGDSRVYLIRHGKIMRITKDQTLVQQLVDAGQITEEEAELHSCRNVVLQSLGAHNGISVDISRLPLSQSDTFVLCTDGLTGKVRADELARVVQSASDLKTACQSLISLANQRGGEDNITVVIVRFNRADLPAPTLDPVKPEKLLPETSTQTEPNWNAGGDTEQPKTDFGWRGLWRWLRSLIRSI